MTPRGVLAFCREKEIRVVDLRFADILGKWHHITLPVRQLTEATFETGCRIESSDVEQSYSCNGLAIPQPSTAFLDAFASVPTLVMICTIQDTIAREDHLLDPRVIAQKAMSFLASTGIADEAKFGIHCEFFWFQSACFQSSNLHSNFSVLDGSESSEAFTHRSLDAGFSARNEITESLNDMGFQVAMHHQRNALGSKGRVDFLSESMVRAGDSIMTLKHVARRVAETHQRSVTFMPKPLTSDSGATMAVNLSLWKGDEPIFGGQSYGGLSETALMAIGGILHHRQALAAICNPTTNSYRRLYRKTGPAFQSGYSISSSPLACPACRAPSHSTDPKSKRIEILFPDPSANPYLALAAILMAAIDGIQNKIEPGKPLEKLTGLKADSNPKLGNSDFPRSLWDSLSHLEQDQAFLLEGDVFSTTMLEQWISYKENFERKLVESDATPSEYSQYFDC